MITRELKQDGLLVNSESKPLTELDNYMQVTLTEHAKLKLRSSVILIKENRRTITL